MFQGPIRVRRVDWGFRLFGLRVYSKLDLEVRVRQEFRGCIYGLYKL